MAALAGTVGFLLRDGPPLGPADRPPLDAAPSLRAERIGRLLILGTSLSHGQTWPGRLADRLEACTGTRPEIEVIARPGATSRWGADALAARTGPLPDAALVEFGVNDADLLDGLSAAESHAAHRRILAALPGVSVAVMRMNPAFGPRGWVRTGRERRETAIALQAEAAGAGLLDLPPRWRARWRGAAARRRADIPDGLHPDPAAAAEVIAPAAAALLVPGCTADGPETGRGPAG